MTLRPATLADAALLLAWRNDPQTRAASRESGPVDEAAHLAWLRVALADPGRRLLVAETDRPVGTVRVDEGAWAEMSWTVAPEWRGRGLGRAIVRAALPPTGPVVAMIGRDNVASRRVAAAAGFRLAADGPLQRWERA